MDFSASHIDTLFVYLYVAKQNCLNIQILILNKEYTILFSYARNTRRIGITRAFARNNHCIARGMFSARNQNSAQITRGIWITRVYARMKSVRAECTARRMCSARNPNSARITRGTHARNTRGISITRVQNFRMSVPEH